MNYALYCTDKADHLSVRLDTRPAHVEYLEDLNANGKLVFAGPTLGEDGKPNGSIVVIDAADLSEAETIAANDPYAKAGLFSHVEIRGWNWVFNKPES